MDNLIFSLNAIVPVFLVIVAGYLFRQMHMLDEGFLNVANKFNFKVTLPVMLFLDLALTNFREAFDAAYILYCFVATLLSVCIAWAVAKLFVKDKRIIGEFVQGTYRSSAAILGIAFIVNICGTSGMAPLMLLGAVPLYNIFAVLILTFEGAENTGGGKENLKKALVDIVKNPIIISIFLGFGYSVLQIPMPQIMQSTLGQFSKLATPLTLLCIGAGFEGRKAVKMLKPTLIASLMKLLLWPALFLPVAIAMGFTGDKLVAAIVMLGSPTTPSSYVMAKNMGHEGVLTSSVVVMTTVLSAFSITFLVFLVRSMGLV